jgi:hypothetical protein
VDLAARLRKPSHVSTAALPRSLLKNPAIVFITDPETLLCEFW